jgi:PAS domain S-box-containing protein
MSSDDYGAPARPEDVPEEPARSAPALHRDAEDRVPGTRWREDATDGPGDDARPASREAEERETAWARAVARKRHRREAGAVAGDPHHGQGSPEVMQRAFAALADNVRDYAIFLMDPDGVITFWGDGARLIKWWSRENAEGAHLRLLYPDGGSEDGTAEAHLAEAAETGEYTGEGHRLRNDCSTFWAGVTLTALRDRGGELLGFVKVTRDLTAQRVSESARQAALEAAEQASRFKSQFLATVSHEVRTPLTSVMAYTDLLKMEVGGPLTQVQRQYLDTMQASSQHLLTLIDDILDVSRAEAGQITVGRSTVSIGSVVSQTLRLVEPHAQRRRIELVDAVSGASAQHRCWGDEERLRQILLNLIGNAIKFTEPGGRVIVSAGTAADAPPGADMDLDAGPWVYFRVEDTGPGIPQDRQKAIFEPFVQVDMSATRRHGGTGLGLAISQRLARLMGGDLTVRSEEGVGATFLLWVPAAADQAEVLQGGAAPMGSAGTLQEIRHAILTELERILHVYVARLRSDPATPGAASLSAADLEDHLASFLADVAQTFSSVSLAEGPASAALRDGTAIQRTIAERHGRQRARLGWQESEIRRELEILGEELAAAVRRRVTRPRREEVEEAIGTLQGFLQRAEAVAVASYREASAGQG